MESNKRKLKYKIGTILVNIHTKELLYITAGRHNCGFPFYYSRDRGMLTRTQKSKYDFIFKWSENDLDQHFRLATKAEAVLYGN